METLLSETTGRPPVKPEPEQPGSVDGWAIQPERQPAPEASIPAHPIAGLAGAQARRRRIAAIVAAGVVVAAAATIIAVAGGGSGSGASSAHVGYGAKLGAAGTGPSLHLPQQIGTLQLLTTNEVPMWTNVPRLLPSSPAATFATVAGDYYNASSRLGMSVDGVYAIGDGQHQGVFTASPAALMSLVAQQLNVAGFQPYPTGPRGGALDCGTFGTEPLCVWADNSTLGFVYYTAGQGAIAPLAAQAIIIRSTVEVG